MLSGIDWKNGIITYNEFHIDLCRPLDEQIFELEEDLLQVKYANRYCIDVGWYPSLEPDGFFWIRVIEDRNWHDPVFSVKIKEASKFIDGLQQAINFTVKFMQENPNRPLGTGF